MPLHLREHAAAAEEAERSVVTLVPWYPQLLAEKQAQLIDERIENKGDDEVPTPNKQRGIY